MEEFYFEKLVVWQKAMSLVRMVYAAAKQFPVEERYALTDQLRRAVVSIPSNIAEGNGRGSNKDYAHFIAIARGSLYETVTQMRIAVDMGYINPNEGFDKLASEIARMLGSMLKKYGALHCSPSPSSFT